MQGKGFVKAGDLGIGTSIVTRAGPSLALREATTKHTARVYNFEVAEFHTYFVGQNALWVHNTCFDLSGTAEDVMRRYGWDPALGTPLLVDRNISARCATELSRKGFNVRSVQYGLRMEDADDGRDLIPLLQKINGTKITQNTNDFIGHVPVIHMTGGNQIGNWQSQMHQLSLHLGFAWP